MLRSQPQVAIAFVFDLDELSYQWLLRPSQRVAFEEVMKQEMREGKAKPRGYCQAYSWLVFMIDFLCMSFCYLKTGFEIEVFGEGNTNTAFALKQTYIRNYIYLRAATMGIAELHLAFLHVWSQGRSVWGAMRLVLQAGWAFTQCILTHPQGPHCGQSLSLRGARRPAALPPPCSHTTCTQPTSPNAESQVGLLPLGAPG